MRKYAAVPIVLGVSAGLVIGELLGEDKPHAEFIAVSPSPMPNANIVFTNGSASVAVYSPENFTPAELQIPRDHLVIQAAGLMPPTKKPTA